MWERHLVAMVVVAGSLSQRLKLVVAFVAKDIAGQPVAAVAMQVQREAVENRMVASKLPVGFLLRAARIHSRIRL